MARVHLPLTVFFAGAAIFCAAGWTSQSLAAFVSHNADTPNDFGANGTAVGALPGAAPSAMGGASGRFSPTANGAPGSFTAPMLAAPVGFERSMRRARELDLTDPWNADRQLRAVVHAKMSLEVSDPWNPSMASPARATAPHKQLMLDVSDPWAIAPVVSKSNAL